MKLLILVLMCVSLSLHATETLSVREVVILQGWEFAYYNGTLGTAKKHLVFNNMPDASHFTHVVMLAYGKPFYYDDSHPPTVWIEWRTADARIDYTLHIDNNQAAKHISIIKCDIDITYTAGEAARSFHAALPQDKKK